MAVTQLIYVSTLVGEAERELKTILESAVRHNQLNGITGMLVYYRGGLMQVLEGGRAAVMATYTRICQDKRHHNVIGLTVAEEINVFCAFGFRLGFRRFLACCGTHGSCSFLNERKSHRP